MVTSNWRRFFSRIWTLYPSRKEPDRNDRTNKMPLLLFNWKAVKN